MTLLLKMKIGQFCITVLNSPAIFFPVLKDTLRLRSYSFYQFCYQNLEGFRLAAAAPFCFPYIPVLKDDLTFQVWVCGAAKDPGRICATRNLWHSLPVSDVTSVFLY